jgi:tRNA pseudouridine32 synthase/23S rRNA pseudouridine746 synthase
LQAEAYPLSNYIIHEDDSLVVINKPSGLLSIPDGYSRNLPNISHLLQSRYGEIWTVHRLDKESSGAIVFARTPQSHRNLSIQFERRKTSKIYHAVVNSVPDWNEKTIRLPLRVNAGRKHLTRADPRHGKPSETSFHVLKRFSSLTLLEARPLTGYRHQIRAHMYALGMNILGDPLYIAGDTADGASFPTVRMMLHAYQLTVIHPISGKPVTYTAPYPDDFSGTLCQIKKAELL